MTKFTILAAAAVLSTVMAAPVMAQTYYGPNGYHRGYDDGYRYRERDVGPGDVAAGIVGGAVAAGAAIATAPFRGAYASDNGYYAGGYDRKYDPDYARRNGFVCQPGTVFRGEDGRAHLCQ